MTDDWQNPEITGRNKQPGRFQNPSLESIPCVSGERPKARLISLNGEWDFMWAPSPEKLDEEKGQWGTISVPSNWELCGYGIPQYSDMTYPYSHDIGNIPSINPDDNPAGLYRRTFTVPDNWNLSDGYPVLRFEGIRSAAQIYLNGKFLGYTQNTYSPSEFKLKEQELQKENVLTVKVFKWCAGTYLEDQDMWRLAGIIRPVSLLFQPFGGIRDVFARCRFDSVYKDAELEVSVYVEPPDSASGARFLRWYLRQEGRPEIIASVSQLKLSMEPGELSTVDTSVFVKEPLQWSADEPNLYELVIEISDEEDRVKDLRIIDFGFRQVDIKQTNNGAVFTVNGRPVKLRGVNRHNIHPRYGQAVPVKEIENDLRLMKQNNINAFRCSHYPNPEEVYQIADRLGLYVMDEANLETHQLRHLIPKSRVEWRKNCVDRMEHMVLNHRNHPSVVIWSLGNEAGFGRNFEEMKKAALVLDSTRPVHYENDRRLAFSDFFSLMYATVAEVERVQRRRSLRTGFAEQGRPLGWRVFPRQYQKKPFIQCEFSHAMGNSLGNFAEYIDIFESTPHIAGGFIWDWADQALYKKNEEGIEYLAYGGEFGDIPNDGIFCADGLVTADRKPQPELAEVKALYAPVAVEEDNLQSGTIRLINRHSHTDLHRYAVSWHLEREGIEVANGNVKLPDIPAGESVIVKLYRDLSAFPSQGEGFLTFEVRLKEQQLWAGAGHLITRLQLPLPVLQPRSSAWNTTEEKHQAADSAKDGGIVWKYQEQNGELLVSSVQGSFSINLKTGALEAVDFGGGNVLLSPLEPDFFRAPTDNEQEGAAGYIDSFFEEGQVPDWVKKISLRLADFIYGRCWDKASSDRRIKKYEVKEVSTGLNITFYARIRGFSGNFLIIYHFEKDGQILCRYRGFAYREGVRFGARTVLPGRFRTIRWYGRGPQECYADRKRGALIGRYEMDADEASHEYLMPQESGNRTDVRRVSFSDGRSAVVFKASNRKTIDFSASRSSREEIAGALHGFEIRKDQNIHVDIDWGQRGVGGSLPGFLLLLKKYKMPAFRLYDYEFSISNEKPGEIQK